MKSLLSLALIVFALGSSRPSLAQTSTERSAIAHALPAAGAPKSGEDVRITRHRGNHAGPGGAQGTACGLAARRCPSCNPDRPRSPEGSDGRVVFGLSTKANPIRSPGPSRVCSPVRAHHGDALRGGEYPRRFLNRSSFYLTFHYSDVAGEPAFETIRLLSEPDALSALDALERDTGLTFDRTLATRSFLGIPIRAAIGARVAVTDQGGQATKGTITQVSASSLALDESAGVARVFDQTSLRGIRLLYSPKHDALVGLGTGTAVGVFGVYLSAASVAASARRATPATATSPRLQPRPRRSVGDLGP